MTKSITLYELNSLVREAIDELLPMSYWVQAELSECRESRGHCYMELVEKAADSNTPVARASAKCWRSTWTGVRSRFERITGQPLRAGQQVMLLVHAQFHEAYGFSWIVEDINPEFTLGDMARRRQEIIRQLKEEGIFDMNRELSLSLLCQRVAVISSASAAGYGDFCHQLENNSFGLRFYPILFPAIMQGEQVEQSVIAALNAIAEREDEFDAVVIIRGGGGTADMSGFDTLALAENVAQFPLPVITGIGHDRDECVLDLVAHTRVKTPTAAAAFLVEHQAEVLALVEDYGERIVRSTTEVLSGAWQQLQNIAATLPLRFARCMARQEMLLSQCETRALSLARQAIASCRHRLELLETRITAADPQRILERGYSLTTLNGRAVRDASQLSEGQCVTTRVAKGTFKSIITQE